MGVGGVARKIKKGYIGVGGVARCCFSAGELAYYGTATALSVARDHLAATTVGNYALFAGGWTGSSSRSATVDAYDTSLTHSIPTSLSTVRGGLAATTVGNYAIFGEGYYDSTADAYDLSLTHSNPSSFPSIYWYQAATTVGNYALFAGGYNSGSSTYLVRAYDSSLTVTVPRVYLILGIS